MQTGNSQIVSVADFCALRRRSSGGQTYGFSYTAASQISQRTAANDNYNWTGPNVSRTYNRNGLNQYTSVSGTGFAYDARGNLTSDGSRTFAYDLENRLLSVSGSASLALAYDPLGRLRQTTAAGTTTDFLYDGDRLVAEYSSTGALLRRYVHGPGVDEPLAWYEGSGLTDRRYLIANHQGSVIAEEGSATTRYSYGPYGEPQTWSGSRFRFTGQIALPEAQLYHYRARVYDPTLGRFLQSDPIGYEDDFNIYGYVRNDPINNADPSGSICLFGWLGIGGSCDNEMEKDPEVDTDTIVVTAFPRAMPATPAARALPGISAGPAAAVLLSFFLVGDTSQSDNTDDPEDRSTPSRPAPDTMGTPQGPDDPNLANLRRASMSELQRAAREDGYSRVEDWKRTELRLNARDDIFVDTRGNLYSAPRQGGGPPQNLGIRVPR